MKNAGGNAQEDGDAIDMDRVVIDPDYRRRVLALMRRNRLTSGEPPAPAAMLPSAASPNSATD